MKNMCAVLFILIVAMVCCFPVPGFADDPKARKIMQQVEDRDDGDHMTSNMLMVLIDKNGDKRKKYFKNYSKDYGKDSKRIMFIERPANIKNTGFLTFVPFMVVSFRSLKS